MLTMSVEAFGQQGGQCKTLHDFGADEELYSPAALQEFHHKNVTKKLEDTKAQLEYTKAQLKESNMKVVFWTKQHKEAFKELRESCVENVVLTHQVGQLIGM
jgi:hypothetical protein